MVRGLSVAVLMAVRRPLAVLTTAAAIIATQALPGMATPAGAVEATPGGAAAQTQVGAARTWISYRHSFAIRVAMPNELQIAGTGISLAKNLHVSTVAVAVSYKIPTPNPNNEICAVSTHAVNVYKAEAPVAQSMTWSDGGPKQVVQAASSIYTDPHKGGPGNTLDCGSSATLQYGGSSLKLEQSASVSLGLSGGAAINAFIYPNWSRSVTLFPPRGNVSTPEIEAGCARLDTGPTVAQGLDRQVYDEACAKVGSPTKVAFVIDNTGSMGGSIEATIAGAKVIAAALPEETELALVTYNDPGSTVVGDFGTDRNAFRAGLDTITVGGGDDYPELVLSGLMKALELNWPEDGCRRIVLLGDAPAKDPEPGTGHTMESVLAAAKKGGVQADTAPGGSADVETGCPETTPPPPADLVGGTPEAPAAPEVVGGPGDDSLDESYAGIVINPVWIGDVSEDAGSPGAGPRTVDGNVTGGPTDLPYWEQTFKPLADRAGGKLSSANGPDQVGNALLGATTGYQVLSANLPAGRVESVTGQTVTGWTSQSTYEGPIDVLVCRTGRTSCVEVAADERLPDRGDEHGFSVDVAFPIEELEVYALAVDSEGNPTGQQVLLVGQPVKRVEVVAPQAPTPAGPAPPAAPAPAAPPVPPSWPQSGWSKPEPEPVTPAEPAMGSLDLVDTGVIAGWARQPGLQRAVEVEIHVDGELYRTVKADEPRQELLDQGIGSYGFRITHDVGPGRTIEAYAVGIRFGGQPNGLKTPLDGNGKITPAVDGGSADSLSTSEPIATDPVRPVEVAPPAPADVAPPVVAPPAPVDVAPPAPVVVAPADVAPPAPPAPPTPPVPVEVGPPAPVAVAPEAPVVTAVPEGSLDTVDAGSIGGWARQPGAPGPVDVEIVVDGVLHRTVRADQHRDDLVGMGIGAVGFSIPNDLGPGRNVEAFAVGVNADGTPNGQRSRLQGGGVTPGQSAAPVVGPPAPIEVPRPAPVVGPPAPVATGAPEGFLDTVDAGSIGGWARQPGAPGPVDVEIVVDGVLHRTVRADQHRDDLVGMGIGAVGFSIPNDLGPGRNVEAFAVGVNADGTPNGQRSRLQGGGVTPGQSAAPVVGPPAPSESAPPALPDMGMFFPGLPGL